MQLFSFPCLPFSIFWRTPCHVVLQRIRQIVWMLQHTSLLPGLDRSCHYMLHRNNKLSPERSALKRPLLPGTVSSEFRKTGTQYLATYYVQRSAPGCSHGLRYPTGHRLTLARNPHLRLPAQLSVNPSRLPNPVFHVSPIVNVTLGSPGEDHRPLWRPSKDATQLLPDVSRPSSSHPVLACLPRSLCGQGSNL